MKTQKTCTTFPRCQVSNDYLWELTRNHSSYLVKARDRNLTLSTDPLNLTGLNTKRDSGIANSSAIGISAETVSRKVVHKKVKKVAPVVKFRLLVKTRRMLPKKRCVALKANPTTNNLVYSEDGRLTTRSIVKVYT